MRIFIHYVTMLKIPVEVFGCLVRDCQEKSFALAHALINFSCARTTVNLLRETHV